MEDNNLGLQNGAKKEFIKKEVEAQIKDRLYLLFMGVGIISFTLGALVNFYTLKRLNGAKK
jgi:hypothetical protein